MTTPIRVGIVGASPNRGWASLSHVPAVQGLPELELTAVATRDQATATRAAQQFGAARGYGDPLAMMGDPEVDVVAVTVRVPAHRELVLAALGAGKHVYCEWPLGRDLEEAEALRDAARAAGVHVAIGLQARANPALLRARALLADGAIGRLLNAHLYSGTVAFGPTTAPADAYLNDPANGATHVSIHVGHALDAAGLLLGGLSDLSALGSVQFREVEVEGEGRSLRRTISDYVLTQSHLERGGVLAAAVAGGRTDTATFRFEVVGDAGTLVLDGAAPRGFQSGRLKLSLNGELQAVDEGELATLPDAAYNVGALYAVLQRDIEHGTHHAPDFEHAVQLTRLLADLDRATDSGARLPAQGWPTG